MRPHTTLLVSLLLTVTFVAGCDAGPPTIRLNIHSNGLRVPDEIDLVVIDATASRTDAGELCTPIRRGEPLDGPDDLPLLVDIVQGDEFDVWTVFRVEAHLTSLTPEEQVIYRHQHQLAWPAEGTREYDIDITTPCYCSAEPGCVDGECNCIDGECLRMPQPGIFLEPEEDRYVEGVSCYGWIQDGEHDGPDGG